MEELVLRRGSPEEGPGRHLALLLCLLGNLGVAPQFLESGSLFLRRP
jgi:hypothetical protein